MKINELKPLDKNPFKGKGDKQIEKIAKSIEDFERMMEIRKIVIDENNQILGGNKRYFALKKLGYKEIPDAWIEKVTDLSEEQKREFIIKDNAHWGSEWDFDLLEEWQVDLEDWGVEIQDFDIEQEVIEDNYEFNDNIETDIVLGDLIEIGEHRLLCGDSTDIEQIKNLMNGEKAEICFTSPPYNIGSDKYINYNDRKNEEEYLQFLINNIESILPYCEDIFYNLGFIRSTKNIIVKLLYNYLNIFKNIIFWHKTTVKPTPHFGMINSAVELILCFGDGDNVFKNPQFSPGSYYNFIEGKSGFNNEFANLHRATFPVYLPENIINNFSNKNSIILDCFLGTGTTMVAAHQLNRRCYGIEIEPVYCQIIIDRMRKLDDSLIIKKNGVII